MIWIQITSYDEIHLFGVFFSHFKDKFNRMVLLMNHFGFIVKFFLVIRNTIFSEVIIKMKFLE